MRLAFEIIALIGALVYEASAILPGSNLLLNPTTIPALEITQGAGFEFLHEQGLGLGPVEVHMTVADESSRRNTI
jgi:hypothetical protein